MIRRTNIIITVMEVVVLILQLITGVFSTAAAAVVCVISVIVVSSTTIGVSNVISLTKSAFIIMHPHLQNPSVHSNFAAELGNRRLVSFLDLPSHPFREFEHFVLLILGEFCSKPLPAIWVWRNWSCCVAHGWVVLRLRAR